MSISHLSKLLLGIVAFWPFAIQAQHCFEGKVISANNMEAVDAVLVFIPFTSYSTITDEKGNFYFEKCPNENFEIVFSHISFQNKTLKIEAGRQSLPMAIRLFENNFELEEIVVAAERTRAERRVEKLLIKALLGNTNNANQCTLENPEVIRYEKNGDAYNVTATDILKFRNEALGYQLNFSLNTCYVKGSQISYKGKPFFQDLDDELFPENKWEKNRQNTFEGSVYHFYKSLRAGSLKDDGFVVYQGRLSESYNFLEAQRILGPELITEIRENGDMVLDFKALKVAYVKERQAGTTMATSSTSLSSLTNAPKAEGLEGDQYSLKNLDRFQTSYLNNEGQEMVIRNDHFPSTSSKIVEYGYWNDERLADLLPYKAYFDLDIDPSQTEELPIAELNGFKLSNLLIPLDEIKTGGPPKDGIPSIDDPIFINTADATFMKDDDLMITVVLEDLALAFPIKILNWHEVVNVDYKGKSFVVTYCPLCRSGMVFNSWISGSKKTFGVSGLLYNSDVLLYDRETQSLWSQLDQRGIAGEASGTTLEWVYSQQMNWKTWKENFSNSKVLSHDTGFNRDYNTDTYAAYHTSQNLLFPVNHTDDRLPKKEEVIAFSIDGVAKAYPTKLFNRWNSMIVDVVNDKMIEIHYDVTTKASFVQQIDQTPVNHVVMYWFAWAAFNPETGLMKKN